MIAAFPRCADDESVSLSKLSPQAKAVILGQMARRMRVCLATDNTMAMECIALPMAPNTRVNGARVSTMDKERSNGAMEEFTLVHGKVDRRMGLARK